MTRRHVGIPSRQWIAHMWGQGGSIVECVRWMWTGWKICGGRSTSTWWTSKDLSPLDFAIGTGLMTLRWQSIHVARICNFSPCGCSCFAWCNWFVVSSTWTLSFCNCCQLHEYPRRHFSAPSALDQNLHATKKLFFDNVLDPLSQKAPWQVTRGFPIRENWKRAVMKWVLFDFPATNPARLTLPGDFNTV